MAYVDIYTVATDDTHVLRKQFAVAIHACAVDVVNEDPGTANHANRIIWARRVTQSANGPVLEAERWIWKLLENATFQSNPTGADDGAVKTVTASFLNLMANVGR